MSKVIDLTGKKFGRLTVLEQAQGRCRREVAWKVRCECGTTKTLPGYILRKGITQSCGCLHKEIASEMARSNFAGKSSRKTHGLNGHPLYNLISNIKSRCYNKNRSNYKYYGGRGITVCDEWRNDPASFISWALDNKWEKGLEIDRINNDGSYSPENCRFVTRQINMGNRRLTVIFNTGTFIGTLAEIADMIGIKRLTLHKRVNSLGWPLELAITTPVRR